MDYFKLCLVLVGGMLGMKLLLVCHNSFYHHTLLGSVADQYHFDTDPDPGWEKIRYGSGSRVNFDTDPDPDKNNTDPDPAKKD